MIRYLHGRIAGTTESTVIVDVGGIGYEVSVPDTSCFFSKVGTETEIFTAMLVREDDISLYGFESPEELRLFRLLMTVNGIGAKASLAILSALSVSEIVTGILHEDVAEFTRANGIGKKTAQRITMELKDKIDGIPELARFAFGGTVEIKQKTPTQNPVIQKAIGALTGLGLSKSEAEEAANACYKDGISAEDLILASLRLNR